MYFYKAIQYAGKIIALLMGRTSAIAEALKHSSEKPRFELRQIQIHMLALPLIGYGDLDQDFSFLNCIMKIRIVRVYEYLTEIMHIKCQSLRHSSNCWFRVFRGKLGIE